MSRHVSGIEEALEVLARMKVLWATVNRIQNSMWDAGVAFFGRNHHRVAYYDEAQNELSIREFNCVSCNLTPTKLRDELRRCKHI